MVHSTVRCIFRRKHVMIYIAFVFTITLHVLNTIITQTSELMQALNIFFLKTPYLWKIFLQMELKQLLEESGNVLKSFTTGWNARTKTANNSQSSAMFSTQSMQRFPWHPTASSLNVDIEDFSCSFSSDSSFCLRGHVCVFILVKHIAIYLFIIAKTVVSCINKSILILIWTWNERE